MPKSLGHNVFRCKPTYAGEIGRKSQTATARPRSRRPCVRPFAETQVPTARLSSPPRDRLGSSHAPRTTFNSFARIAKPHKRRGFRARCARAVERLAGATFPSDGSRKTTKGDTEKLTP